MERLVRFVILLGALALVALAATGCDSPVEEPTPTPAPAPTLVLPPADKVAFSFLQAWERSDYAAMYGLLSATSQEAYSEESFTTTYGDIAEEATIQQVATRILTAFQPGTRAEVVFAAKFQTALVGEFEVQNQMALVYEEGR
jgi:hypothetical protein